mmetsp:Transcript_1934/g.3443  ORF Transcript_1934/g.3443 Transcript_1934/m.3443 type:complete len:141 (+) Transcript_1934:37-459(+)
MASVTVEVIFWLWAFLSTCALLFFALYDLLLFSDLSQDHINPIELCDRLNPFIRLEYVCHALLSLAFFMRFYWILGVVNLPLVIYHIRSYISGQYLLEYTSVFDQLPAYRKVMEFKLGFYIILFISYIFCFTQALLRIKR